MIALDRRTIRIGAQSTEKADAIRQAGSLLVDAGRIMPGYIDSMMEREQVANTYLGKGVAIPHGLPKDREMILSTGIAVVQFPEGVTWNPGETVYLVVAIAARSDEHLDVLANLTRVLDEEATIRALATTTDPDEILAALTRPRDSAPPPAPEVPPDFPAYADLTIRNPTGLHARPATVLAGIAREFRSEVRLRYGDKIANGKSLASLLELGAERGSTVRVMARGPDEQAVLAALKDAVESGLGEEEGAPDGAATLTPAYQWEVEAAGMVLPAIPASPGLAIGPLRYAKRSRIVVEATARDPAVETTRLRQALETARSQLKEIYQEVKQRSGVGKAAIFLAHAEFLNDPELIQETLARIEAGASAAWAWQQAIASRVAALEALDDPVLAARAVDLGDVGDRVLRSLASSIEERPELPTEPAILVAEDLTPSDTAILDPKLILGFCTAGGGPTSHSAIIARALGIPALVGVGPAVLHQREGCLVILDGNRGMLYIEPSSATLKSALIERTELEAAREEEMLSRYQPAILTDGRRVGVVANISRVAEAEHAVNAGAEGVGLLRTEFLFLNRAAPPDEEEQYQAYREMVRALNGLPLIIRTLDIGGDKNVPYLHLTPEQNPFLGVRGIRLCLARPDLFRPQLRAIYRAVREGPVKIMFPMIATLEELQAAKTLAEEARREVGSEPVEVGMMVEVPSAVLMADEFAPELDFFSIGTNDLAQYTFAMDRGHPVLGKQADGLHPAVLRLVDQTVCAAGAAGKWVGVCGGIAGDPLGAAILTGLGVAELSVSIPSVAAVKAALRRLSFEETQALARRALACRTAAEVRALLPGVSPRVS